MRLTKDASQGPWELWRDECNARHGDHDCDCEDPKVDIVRTPSGDIVCETEGGYANAAFIAHAHPGRVSAYAQCVARLRERTKRGHEEDCLSYVGGACTCGHDLDLAALAAVDKEKAP